MGSVFQVILIYLTASCIVESCNKKKRPTPHYPDVYCKCGQKNFKASSRIVGGYETDVNEYPWIAHLYSRRAGRPYLCAGSIISERYILTAAHCVTAMKPTDFKIYLGEHDRSYNSEPYIQIHYAQSIIIHKDYHRQSVINDVALIQTKKKMEFSTIIHPVCLPEPGQDFSGEMATVIGWGKPGISGIHSDVLKEVRVKVLSDRECKLESNNDIRQFKETLCAIGYRKGICLGDSGGPLMITNRFGDYEQIGVVSFTYECSSFGFPDGYARVTNYLQWIREYTEYCSKRQLVNKM